LQFGPVHPDPHEQVPGAEHVPLFEHVGKHTAKNNRIQTILPSNNLLKNWIKTRIEQQESF